MTDFSSSTFPRPKDWQAFERHSRVLFEHILGDPNSQNNGRAGQPQHGVDIFGKRGGASGPMVGIQCKGKDTDYGGSVTRTELRAEVEKTKKFKPELKEFILITTAPDDAGIQEEARLLEKEVRGAGRDLTIAVWGWETIHQRIILYPDVIKAFHPDASPFSDVIRDDARQIKELVQQQHHEVLDTLETRFRALESRVSETKFIAADTTIPEGLLDKTLNAEIDRYRDLIKNGKARTAIALLTALMEQTGLSAPPEILFRILTNIGAAHHGLGEFNQAADLFLSAAPLRPDDPVGMTNAIAANLIKGQRDAAHMLALRAQEKHPSRAETAIQRLQARAPGETVSAVWVQLPSSAKEQPNVSLFRVIATREEAIDDWRVIADQALSAFPENPEIRVIHAEAIVDRALSPDPRTLGLQTGEPLPRIGDIAAAAEVLAEAWRTSLGKETPAAFSHAHNAALAFNLVGDHQKSAELLDAAIDSGSIIEATKRLRISLFARNGKIAEALNLASTLPDTPMSRVVRAELTARTNPVAAREIVSDREDYTEKTDVIGAAYVVIDTCLAESQFEEARKEAQRLENLLPDDPEALIAMFRVLSSTGDTDAGKYLERAITKIGPETPPESRMLVADCLSQAGRDDDVVDLLYKHVDYTLDSLALQLLIQSAANADRRKILNEALTAVPDEIRDLPFYRRARTALALCTGNIDAAEQEVRGFLAVEPRNLNMHLQLLQLLARREKIDQLRTEVARPASDFDGKPRDFVFFAQFKDKFGSWQEAHDLAYRYWLLNQSDPNVCLAYTGLFLLPGHSEEIDIAPQEIGTNMAVSIENADRTKDIYVLEYDPSLRPNLKYLPPNHKLTECLLKHKVGDEVELPDGSNGRIVWIKPKYLHAFHEILESFGNVFPDVSGIERVRFNTDAPEGLQPIIERVRGRHDAIESVFEAYERGQVPISIAGQVLGFDPVKSLGALISSGRTLRVCEGTEPERGAALSAIDSNGGGGCVVDAITLQIMRRLSLCEAVAAVVPVR